MSWQRIDENTYIDDTLVTCAEYQLFIDEMREQGKYHQPDHWTSYQYPKGQAREPVLGMRYSDTIAFCEWLTKRGTAGWQYRLPIQDEANIHPVKTFGQNSLGYWLDKQFQFTWMGPVLDNAIELDMDRTLTRIKHFLNTYDYYFGQHIDLANALFRSVTSTLDRRHTNSLDHALTIIADFANALSLNINTSHDQELAINLKRTHDLAASLEQAYEKSITSDPNSGFVVKRSIAVNLIHALLLYIWFDLVTLRERIAGRSPAFEGIRLVKERIR